MWNEIFNLAIKDGIWAVLFLGLFVFVIRDSSKREHKYQQTIKDLTSHLGIVKSIKEDVDEIKNFVYKNKRTKTTSKTKQCVSEKSVIKEKLKKSNQENNNKTFENNIQQKNDVQVENDFETKNKDISQENKISEVE